MSILMEIKTVQTGVFKTLIEALKELITDCQLYVTPKGLFLTAIDTSKTILIKLELPVEKFDEFTCTRDKIKLGINMQNFYKIIKTTTQNDTLSLSMDASDESILLITMINSEKNYVKKLKFKLIEVDEGDDEELKIPPLDFQSMFTMPSTEFQKLCRDMSILSDKIELKSIGKTIVASCNGSFANEEIMYGEKKDEIECHQESEEIIQGYYSLTSLLLFTKCTGLCNSIKLMLRNNFPIIVSYIVGNLGDLTLFLAPKEDEESM